MKRIILIGYMGSGKTTVGRQLALSLGLQFYDLDWYIEMRYHKKVSEIFAEQGEAHFRDLESRMLHEVAEFEDVVVSCGGGTPCFGDNMQYMNQQAETVYLKATPEVLCAHLSMGRTVRPLILGKTGDELQAYIRQSLAEREPFYSQAKHTLDVNLLDNFEKISITIKLLREELGL
ncbi:MAG: shikimate kinase [Bacteroidaceae bacterium]|nr:shikimate kinase [Bacteroidaceae bacterium]MBP1531790.1 shikimate kinase [Bacteroidaceae bacterium]